MADYSGTVTVSVHSRALQRAAELLGGREKLAHFLAVPLADITRWIAGTAKPPQPLFLRVVEFIIDETTPPESDAAGDTPQANDCAPAERRY